MLLAAIGLVLFCLSYALMNQFLLVHSILYRAAANDFHSAIWAFAGLSTQALILLAATIGFRRRYFAIMCVIIAISAMVNIVYGQILNDTLDAGKFQWLLNEARQAGNAAGEFTWPIITGLIKLFGAIAFLSGARLIFRSRTLLDLNNHQPAATTFGLMALLLLPSFILSPLGLGPAGAERNTYSLAFRVVTADELPKKTEVTIPKERDSAVKKIVWLVDESISHEIYRQVIRPDVADLNSVDFGGALSLSHCSGPSNFALRSGFDADQVNAQSDLRTMPSIWAYAEKAGFHTTLIDGQVSGPPQNIMLPTERVLIDQYITANNGLKTDQEIAEILNNQLKEKDRQFIYVVLKGVHFQYRDHYPNGYIPDDASVFEQYEAAVRYSKAGFFKSLLDGLDRQEVAILYTSDHGQNIADGKTPHCTPNPPIAEFEVPMIGFLPAEVYPSTEITKPGVRSTGQMFSTTLELMGFDSAKTYASYDNHLYLPSKRPVWFGRNAVPLNNGDRIDFQIHKSDDE